MQITSLKLMPIVGPCRRFYWQLLSSVRPRLRASQAYAYAGARGLLWLSGSYWTGGIAALILS